MSSAPSVSSSVSYSVLLLPRREVAARGLSLREASAWIRTYNDVLQGNPAQAVIAEEAHLATPQTWKPAA